MKKKSRPVIPDFSRKRPFDKTPDKMGTQKPKPFGPRSPSIKPQSTSSKSGRRGS